MEHQNNRLATTAEVEYAILFLKALAFMEVQGDAVDVELVERLIGPSVTSGNSDQLDLGEKVKSVASKMEPVLSTLDKPALKDALTSGAAMIASALKDNAEKAEKQRGAETRAWHPVVVYDFSAVTDEKVLLIPPGRHVVPKYFFKNRDCTVLGMLSNSGEKPILCFDQCTGKSDYDDPETGETIEVFSTRIHKDCRFAYLKIEAENKTILECSEQLAESLCEAAYRVTGMFNLFDKDKLFYHSKVHVDFGENIEIYDMENENFTHEHPWAIEACRG